MTEEGAFDEAVKGVDHIVHVVSPFLHPTEDLENIFIKPAVKGTVGVIYSALKESTIKSVVITSSVFPLSVFEGKDPGILTPESFAPDPEGPYANHFVAYAAGKILAYNRTMGFIKKEQPEFSIINVLPAFVISKNELATTPESVNSGSNADALAAILGQKSLEPVLSISVHIDDVARIHVQTLDPTIEENHNLAASSEIAFVYDLRLAISRPSHLDPRRLPCPRPLLL
jgi:nucleoside-diphosphate-sugar epimerase